MKNWILLGIVCLMTVSFCMAEPGELGDKTQQCLVPDPNRPGQQMLNCAGFDELRIRCESSEEKKPPYSVSMYHRLVNVPCTGFYVIRYWPKGRHDKYGFFDYLIGDIKAGNNSSGDLDSCIRKGNDLNPCEMEKVKCDEKMAGSIDLEVWPNEADYKADKSGAMLGQCDRRCSVEFGCENGDCVCRYTYEETGPIREKKNICVGDPLYGKPVGRYEKELPCSCSNVDWRGNRLGVGSDPVCK